MAKTYKKRVQHSDTRAAENHYHSPPWWDTTPFSATVRYYTILTTMRYYTILHQNGILHHPPPQWDTAPPPTMMRYCTTSHNDEILHYPPQWWDTAPSSTIMGYYTTSVDTVWKNKQESPSVSKGMEASQPQPAACGHMTLCSHYYKYLAIHCQNTSKNGIVREFWALVWKLQENKILRLQFLQNIELFLKCAFVLLPGVAGRNVASAAVTHAPLWKNTFLPRVACPCDWTLLMWFFCTLRV